MRFDKKKEKKESLRDDKQSDDKYVCFELNRGKNPWVAKFARWKHLIITFQKFVTSSRL